MIFGVGVGVGVGVGLGPRLSGTEEHVVLIGVVDLRADEHVGLQQTASPRILADWWLGSVRVLVSADDDDATVRALFWADDADAILLGERSSSRDQIQQSITHAMQTTIYYWCWFM